MSWHLAKFSDIGSCKPILVPQDHPITNTGSPKTGAPKVHNITNQRMFHSRIWNLSGGTGWEIRFCGCAEIGRQCSGSRAGREHNELNALSGTKHCDDPPDWVLGIRLFVTDEGGKKWEVAG